MKLYVVAAIIMDLAGEVEPVTKLFDDEAKANAFYERIAEGRKAGSYDNVSPSSHLPAKALAIALDPYDTDNLDADLQQGSDSLMSVLAEALKYDIGVGNTGVDDGSTETI